MRDSGDGLADLLLMGQLASVSGFGQKDSRDWRGLIAYVLYLLSGLVARWAKAAMQRPDFRAGWSWSWSRAWRGRRACCLRSVTQRSSRNHYQIADELNSENRLLQKAVLFHINACGLSLDAAQVSLLTPEQTGAADDDRPDRRPIEERVDRFQLVVSPPLDEWVTVMTGPRPADSIQVCRRLTREEGERANGGAMETHDLLLRSYSGSAASARALVDGFLAAAVASYRELLRNQHDPRRFMYMPLTGRAPAADSRGDSRGDRCAVTRYKRYPLSEQRGFDQFYHPEKANIVKLIRDFQNKTGKFAIAGFPDKLGFLLHGPPGTGKTTFIKSLAKHTGRHIVSIGLDKIRTNQELMDIVHDRAFRVDDLDLGIHLDFRDIVFVMEDVDAAASATSARSDAPLPAHHATLPPALNDATLRPVSQDEDRLNLAGVLNVLDGVLECPDRIVVMTTNHPERLDPALIRPGRVNRSIFMGPIEAEPAEDMIARYFRGATGLHRESVRRGAAAAAASCITPATLEMLCGQHDDIAGLLAALTTPCEAKLE